MENTTNLTSFSPKDWFSISTVYSEPYLAFNESGVWPWPYITEEDYFKFAHQLQLTGFISSVYLAHAVGYYVGLLGSFLILFTVRNKFSKNHVNSFYCILALVAFSDAVFLALKFARDETQKLKTFGTSRTAQNFHLWASGIAYTCSLLSDMLTLALTIERFVALSFPVFHRSIPTEKKLRVWIAAVLISFIVACTRLHYVFDSYDVSDASFKTQLWFIVISSFSDDVIPFFLTGVMLVLGVGISRALYVRHRQQKVKISNIGSKDERRAVGKALKTVSLLLCLMGMYLLNQIGYMLYSTATLLMAKQSLEYSSSYSDVAYFVRFSVFHYVSVYLSGPLEVASRSLVFYAYVVCNSTFRTDFLDAMRGRQGNESTTTTATAQSNVPLSLVPAVQVVRVKSILRKTESRFMTQP